MLHCDEGDVKRELNVINNTAVYLKIIFPHSPGMLAYQGLSISPHGIKKFGLCSFRKVFELPFNPLEDLKNFGPI